MGNLHHKLHTNFQPQTSSEIHCFESKLILTMPTESGYLYGRKSIAWTLLQPTTDSFCFFGMVWNNPVSDLSFGGMYLAPDGRLSSLLHLYTGWRNWLRWYFWGDIFAQILQTDGWSFIHWIRRTNGFYIQMAEQLFSFFRAESGPEQLIQGSSYHKYVKYWTKKRLQEFWSS